LRLAGERRECETSTTTTAMGSFHDKKRAASELRRYRAKARRARGAEHPLARQNLLDDLVHPVGPGGVDVGRHALEP
jgi:hypothetical protein